MAQTYDYILGLIPVVLGSLTTLLTAVGVSFHMAVFSGGVGSALLVGYALFATVPDPEAVEEQPPTRADAD